VITNCIVKMRKNFTFYNKIKKEIVVIKTKLNSSLFMHISDLNIHQFYIRTCSKTKLLLIDCHLLNQIKKTSQIRNAAQGGNAIPKRAATYLESASTRAV